MNKNKKAKTKPSHKAELFFTFVPIILAITLLWRSVPDGVYRLDLGQSELGEKAIALTFDDGPSGHTERLLDGLAQYGAKATFFVIGKQAEKRPAIVKRAFDEGHLIGNHTYDHPNFYVTPDNTAIESIEKGEKVIQETRGWNDATGKTTSQRSKEVAADYRYMPEPDIPPIVLTQEYVDQVKSEMAKMPDYYREKFEPLKLDESEREAILNYQLLAERLAEVCDKDIKLAPRVAHWFSGVLLSEENLDKDFSLATANELTELSEMVEKNELSSTAGKEVFVGLYNKKNTSKSPHELAKEMNLLQENDEGALEQIIDEVLQAPECQKAAEDVRSGEMKAIGFLVGQVMKKSNGKANPGAVNKQNQKKLS